MRSGYKRAFITIFLVAFIYGVIKSQTHALPFPGRTPGNKLTASDTEDGDRLGEFVAISGTIGVASAPGDVGESQLDIQRGSVYVFDLTTGAELFNLVSSDIEDNDHFGTGVGVSGNVVIVGANNEGGDGHARGAAYLFDLQSGDEIRKLTASDAQDSDFLGSAVAIAGNRAVATAPGEDGPSLDVNANRGAAYVFEVSTGQELFKLTPEDSQDGDFWGTSVAISADVVLVGSENKGDEGSAYVFDLASGQQRFKLVGSDSSNNDNFGFSVAIVGNIGIIGAINRGAAYLFNLTTGEELGILELSDGSDNTAFGVSVAASGDLILVGAEDDGSETHRGAAYLFDLTSRQQIQKLTAVDQADSDLFGFNVALSGNRAIVGALREDGDSENTNANRGAAYVFEFPNYRPDNLVGRLPFTGLGNDIYNLSGAQQTQGLVSRRLRRVRGWFTITNDGDRSDNLIISGSRMNRLFRLEYFRVGDDVREKITAQVVAGLHTEVNVDSGEQGRLILAEVTPSRRLKRALRKGRSIRKTFWARVTSASENWEFRKDTAGIRVRTR